ncbi:MULTISPECIES: DinB family protein [Streptomyces]|uniref:DinB family protein n=1 Tax=Streptomyces solicathayae TaxID=3081768 RepID=A0ABZ0LM57_9ACTN|nr:DinB family protein [Streptomyces sp. HUAS YS2]WOX20573.1 DinB family protein [Streptomyces sp. HUAS YS2]
MSESTEVRTLLSVLNDQRRHVLGALEGLPPEALHKPVLPSGWTCAGLVRHLTLDVERWWFQAVFSGDQEIIAGFDDADDAWQVSPATPVSEVLEGYREECARADALVASSPADTPLAWWPHHLFGPPHLHTLRDVLLHVITETACHAGHLDAARELLDGRQYRVLD